MVGNGGEIGQYFSRRLQTSGVNSPRRISRALDSDSFMELPKLPKPLQRGSSFKAPSPIRYQNPHYLNVPNRSPCQRNLWVTLLLCLSSLLCLSWFLLRRGQYETQSSHNEHHKGFGVVVGISSREAKIDVFEYAVTETLAVEVLGSKSSFVASSNNGFNSSSYDASALVFDHLEYARRYIPQGERSRTRVYILGSGGLEGPSGWIRKLPKLLEECRKIIHGSDFQFRDDWATVIDGRDEGVYEWVAANYAHGMLQNDPSDTIGVLTLGDQSAQVTFVSNVVPLPTDLYKIELQGTTHYLYSHGFAKLGLEAASEDLLNLMQSRNVSGDVGDTCTPRGYVIPKHNRTEASVAAERTGTEGTTEGIATEIKVRPVLATGNFTACRAESLRLLQMGQGITLVPEFRGNFIATRKFYQTSKYFSLPATATIADLVSAGEKYCNQEWGVGVSKDPYPEYKAVQKPCFSAAYIVAFLHDSLGLPLSDNKVMFTDAVNSVPVQFGLGFFTSKLLEENFVFSSPVVKNGELFGNLVLFLGLLAFCGVLLWFVARWRRPQLKTIYDLEKGRYITTAGRGR
ncbi:probable apyrase 6 [Physcomitrium patens]|uniref:Apyrase n=1 Tax=Physcomitrium patens TaxID=3218 RepID=A0A2K1IJ82_PHYPA|nr:probable apyrase 6 [Physcomitrium patens]XP_024362751.1 probable apyrase 6 [Physcomitrium patens]XP_024362752.1 probable apyrase 6 [Physcomitrium patens]XP_024362753.1 probable apyrase 6 [Physcomitrium patens]XP_024362754.1 probable apyrase 6 [Physcomitrium patens]PNR29338.1 hypothetical protein PHYPA_028030 [Physcomitrium patens]|eukprot:XP_024362749.1 probable apyrase 6 [Physcomitrella patens]